MNTCNFHPLRWLVPALLAVWLPGCGGERGLSVEAARPAPPASAPVTASFPGKRSAYTITRTIDGYLVADANGSTLVTDAQKLQFSDLSINLEVWDKSRQIAAADLRMLTELYIAFFNRVPEADGLAYWIDQLRAGMTINQIADSFYVAAIHYSTQTGYSASMSNSDFVKVIYKNVLGRSGATAPPDIDVKYWADQLASGQASKGSLISIMLVSAHSFAGDAVWGWVPQLLDNKLEIGNFFAVQHGLNYNTPEISISQGMAIAGAVTPTDTKAAYALIAVADSGYASHFNSDTVTALPAEVKTLTLAAQSILAYKGLLDAKLSGGELRFATLGDSGASADASVTYVGSDGKTRTLPILIASGRQIAAQAVSEKADAGAGAAVSDTLQFTGLYPGNFVLKGMGALSIKLVDMPAIDATETRILLTGNEGNNTYSSDITTSFTWDAANATLSLPASAVDTLYSNLPNYPVTLSLGLLSADRNFSRNYDVLLQKGTASIAGKLVNASGTALTALAGRKIDVVGYNNGIRRVVEVGADGSFTVNPVVADTYEISVADLDLPKAVFGIAVVTSTDTSVNFTLNASLLLPGGAPPETSNVLSGSAYRGNGAKAMARELPPGAPGVMPAPACSPSAGVFTVTSATEGVVQSCAISYEIAAGSKQVQVETLVTSAEYPNYTRSPGNKYNDAWSYAVSGIPGTSIVASGQVSNTHYSSGSLATKQCVDVSAYTQNAGLTIGGSLTATNVGDSAYPTTVSVTIKSSCSGLTISKAEFSSPNQAGYAIIVPKNATGNISANYLSVPIGQAEGAWGVPLRITYAPKEATLSELNLSFVRDSENIEFGNKLALAVVKPGTVEIANFVMPQVATTVSAKRFQIKVVLKGSLSGNAAESDAVPVRFGSALDFTPLYLAGENSTLALRRYGTRDTGADSWAVADTVNWLKGKSYRFDDISGLHVPQIQLAGGWKSALGHSGHSDGRQIDMRYSDGSGGYNDALGGSDDGAQILALANAAQAEVAANAASKPNLATLKKWIADNRAMIAAEAPSARKIYFGNGWMTLLLKDGKFPNQSVIDGVGKWTSCPSNATPESGHQSHWHISRY